MWGVTALCRGLVWVWVFVGDVVILKTSCVYQTPEFRAANAKTMTKLHKKYLQACF